MRATGPQPSSSATGARECAPRWRSMTALGGANKNAARNWAAFGFEVQRSLVPTYTGMMKVSILVVGVEAFDLAQQRRPDQRRRAQFLAVGVGEHGGVLVDHGLVHRVWGRA